MRHISSILLDRRFLPRCNFGSALEEQKRTKELLGQVLGNMGVLSSEGGRVPRLVHAVLLVTR